jgi:hypothetical protein
MRLDASPKLRNYLSYVSALCWAMAPERCAWSGGEGKRLVEGVLSVPRAERAHRGRRLRLDLGVLAPGMATETAGWLGT